MNTNTENFFQSCWFLMKSRHPRLQKVMANMELELMGLPLLVSTKQAKQTKPTEDKSDESDPEIL